MDHFWVKVAPLVVRRRLIGKYNLQRALTNTGWLLADQLLRMGLGFIVGAWVARFLGPDQYGEFSYAIAFVALFSILANLGVTAIVVRDLIREPDKEDEILGTTFVLRLVSGIIAFGVTTAAVYLVGSEAPIVHVMVIILAATLALQAFDVIDCAFQARVRSRNTVLAKGAAFLIVAALKVWLILRHAPLVAFVWLALGESALAAVLLLAAYRLAGERICRWRPRLSRMWVILSDSWVLILYGAAILLQTRIDQLMLGQMIGNAELGQFSVAMRLIEALGFVPVIVANSIAPSVTRAKLAGDAIYHNRLLNIYRLMTVLFVAVAAPLVIFGQSIVVLAFGEQYASVGSLLSLFAVRLFFVNIGVGKGLFISNESLFRYALVSAIAGAVVNIALNFVLIPRHGAVGALWATIGSSLTAVFIVDLFWPATRINMLLVLRGITTPYKLRFH